MGERTEVTSLGLSRMKLFCPREGIDKVAAGKKKKVSSANFAILSRTNVVHILWTIKPSKILLY